MKNYDEQMKKWSQLVNEADKIDTQLYTKYEVKKGLRDLNGKGVLAGLTRIGEVHSYIMSDGEMIPQDGRLIYRGMDINQLVDGFLKDRRPGFEETAYLLLMGELPTEKELSGFVEILNDFRTLPEHFVRDLIMGVPCKDMMNVLARSVLALYSYDDNPDNTSIDNVLKQSMRLISVFPLLAVYGYQSYRYYKGESSLVIHSPKPELSTAQNILHMLRHDHGYTELEAELLDIALVLHAEHGGGNNSSFTAHVVTSSGTDIYSAIAASLGSLKGPRHGGANIKVAKMFDEMKQVVSNWEDEEELKGYLTKLLNKEAFDKLGLIYGIGHAVYSISDPRAIILKKYAHELAIEKGLEKEYELYERVEKLAPEVINEKRQMYKGVSANVDFYSGFVYRMLGIPEELYTPLFAISRITGWCAHVIEEIVNNGKIIRPAYRSVAKRRTYSEFEKREIKS